MDEWVVSVGAGNDQILGIKTAQKIGLKVLAIDGNKHAPGLKFADAGLNVCISDEALAIEAAQKYDAKAVIPSPIGRYITTVGAINDALGLRGTSRLFASICQEKSQFNQVLRQGGLNCPKQIAISIKNAKKEGQQEIADAILQMGLPCIIKPCYGSGSRGVRVICNEQDIETAIQDHLAQVDDVSLVEELIEGTEYSVNGVVIAGEIKVLKISEKIKITPLPYRQEVAYYSNWQDEETQKLVKEVEKSLNKLLRLNKNDFAYGLFNCDLMINSDKELFWIEMSPRGGMNFILLFGKVMPDYLKECISMLLKRDYSFDYGNQNGIVMGYFDIEGKVKKVPDLADLKGNMKIIEYECNITPGEVLNKVKSGQDIYNRGYFLMKADTRDEAINSFDSVINKFEIRY